MRNLFHTLEVELENYKELKSEQLSKIAKLFVEINNFQRLSINLKY
jgi:hypothetical protein